MLLSKGHALAQVNREVHTELASKLEKKMWMNWGVCVQNIRGKINISMIYKKSAF